MFNVGCGVVRGLAGVWGPIPSVPEIPAPPAAAAARSPGPPASDGAETAPSDAAPPAKQAHVTTALLTTLMLLFAAIVVFSLSHLLFNHSAFHTLHTASCAFIHTFIDTTQWLLGLALIGFIVMKLLCSS